MANDSSPLIPSKEAKRGKEAVTPNYEKILYAPERVSQWVRGELTLQDLHAISGPEMLALASIGYSMFKEGKYDEAKVIFEGLNALNEKESYYLTALGAVHLVQENLDMAERCFNAAIKLNEQDLAAYVNRGEVFLRLGKILEAGSDFKRAVDLDPEGKDPMSHRARILAAAALEMLEAAEREAQNQSKSASAPKNTKK